jgi:hypothetical protein
MAKELVLVVSADYAGEYRILLHFSDGVSKTVDFSRWLSGKVFQPLRDYAEFRRFFVAGGTVCWPNGADIAPETLRDAQDVASTAA